MLKKIPLLLLLMVHFMGNNYAQERRFERIEAMKVAFITERLSLSAEQAQHFWPVYNAYEKELRRIRGVFLDKYRNSNDSAESGESGGRMVDNNIDYQQQIIDLKRKYQPQFLKTISEQQLDELYLTERIFKQKLLQQLRKGRNRQY